MELFQSHDPNCGFGRLLGLIQVVYCSFLILPLKLS